MSIVRFEPHLMSSLVKRWERGCVKPREVKSTSGLTQPQDPGSALPALHWFHIPPTGLAAGLAEGWFLAEGLFEQLGAEELLGVLTGTGGR